MSPAVGRSLFAAVAVAFFATPMILLAVGVHARRFENRRLADPPRLSQGWRFFDQATGFLTDRLPLREQAVKANTKISQRVFGTTPRYGTATGDRGLPFATTGAGRGAARPADAARGESAPRPSRALEGTGSWLFLSDEVTSACSPPVPVEQARKRLEDLVAIVRASGRPTVLVVPPDKGSIYPEHFAGVPSAPCAGAGKREFWRVLGAAPTSTGVLPLRDQVLARKRDSHQPIYSPGDTHWNAIGAFEMVRAALGSVGRGVRVGTRDLRDAGTIRHTGDLTVLSGDPNTELLPRRVIKRTARARRVRGRTLLVGDSFSDAAVPLLKPYVADLRRLSWDEPTARFVAEIAAADTVIFESVEHTVVIRANDRAIVTQSFLDRLRDRLRAG